MTPPASLAAWLAAFVMFTLGLLWKNDFQWWAPRLAKRILALAALVVPRSKRSDMRREWLAELEHEQHEGTSGREPTSGVVFAAVDILPAGVMLRAKTFGRGLRALGTAVGWQTSALGLVIVYGASEVLSYLSARTSYSEFVGQCLSLAVGAAAMLILMHVDYHRFQRWAPGLAVAAVVMLVLVVVPHIGVERNGARQLFDLGSLFVQPSAIALVLAIVVLARWLSKRASVVGTWQGIRDYSIVLAIPLALILLEKDLFSTIVMAGLGLVLLFLGGGRKRHMISLIGICTVDAGLTVLAEPYRVGSLINDLRPFLLGCQHLLGFGNDAIREPLGLIGTLSVLAAFAFLAWRGVRASRRAPDAFGFLLAAGMTACICLQALVNVTAITGALPANVAPQPFVTYGSTSLIMSLLSMGILCNVSAHGRRKVRVACRYT
jgi:cell division protein FtsW